MTKERRKKHGSPQMGREGGERSARIQVNLDTREIYCILFINLVYKTIAGRVGVFDVR